MTDTEHGFEPKWTPGKWSTDGINDEVINCEPLHEVVSETATCEGASVRVAGAFDIDESVFPGIGSARANAELIALAPELAAAVLDQFSDVCHCDPDEWDEGGEGCLTFQCINTCVKTEQRLRDVYWRLRMIGADE